MSSKLAIGGLVNLGSSPRPMTADKGKGQSNGRKKYFWNYVKCDIQ